MFIVLNKSSRCVHFISCIDIYHMQVFDIFITVPSQIKENPLQWVYGNTIRRQLLCRQNLLFEINNKTTLNTTSSSFLVITTFLFYPFSFSSFSSSDSSFLHFPVNLRLFLLVPKLFFIDINYIFYPSSIFFNHAIILSPFKGYICLLLLFMSSISSSTGITILQNIIIIIYYYYYY